MDAADNLLKLGLLLQEILVHDTAYFMRSQAESGSFFEQNIAYGKVQQAGLT